MSNALPLPWNVADNNPDSFATRTQANFDAVAANVGTVTAYTPWIAPTLLNSWVTFSGTDSQPGYYKDSRGIVRVRGLVKNGSAASAVIFTLPAGFRPALNVWVPGSANGAFCSLRVLSTGDVSATAGGSTTWTSLDSITFRAEA